MAARGHGVRLSGVARLCEVGGRSDLWKWVDWPTCAVLSAIVLGTLVAIAYAALTPRPGRMGPDEALAALAWTLLDLATLGVALLTCFELPYRRRNQRFAIREAVELTVGGTTFFGRTENLSLSGALIAFDAPVDLAPGAAVSLALAGAALPRARVARILIAGGLVAVAFGDLAADARRALTRRVYLGPEPKPEPVIVNGAAIFRGVVRRYARMDI